ncbi:hypothetical protein R0I01_17300 [Bacillus pumilus]|nr:hypothetical protein R0I01_17300 [Bacillus pumilus]
MKFYIAVKGTSLTDSEEKLKHLSEEVMKVVYECWKKQLKNKQNKAIV